jgi:hypothetical protein
MLTYVTNLFTSKRSYTEIMGAFIKARDDLRSLCVQCAKEQEANAEEIIRLQNENATINSEAEAASKAIGKLNDILDD